MADNPPIELSLCMIVKNEATNLARCLSSVEPIADELIVLDTGSTDETIAIAKQHGAAVHRFEWNHDFSAARNESLKFAQGDWILVLDADEVLVREAVPAMRTAMQHDRAIVVNLLRQEIGAVQSPYSLVSRLFRRHPDLHFNRPYHAMIDDSVAALLQKEPDWQIVDLPKVAIRHYGYEPGAIADRNKLQTAKAAMEIFWAAHPDDAYVCSKLGALYMQTGDLRRGIELLEHGMQTPADAPVKYELHYHLGIAHSRLKNLELAAKHYWSAIDQPILPRLKLGAYNNLGGILKAQGDLTTAKTLYETCLNIDPTFATGYYNLGMTLKAIGQFPEAVRHYQKAIDLNPSYADAYQNLGVVLLKLGRVPDSLAAFQRAIALHESTNPQEAARLRQGLREMGF